MGKYLKLNDKIQKVIMKYNIGARNDRKNLGDISVEEHKRLIEREFEIVSGKTYKEILDGTVEERNHYLHLIKKSSYKLALTQKGLNYLLYKEKYLKPYLNEDGTLNETKLDKLYNQVLNSNDKYETYEKLRKSVIEKSELTEKYDVNLWHERNDLLKYLPQYNYIHQYGTSNILVLEYVDMTVETLDVNAYDTENMNFAKFNIEFCAQNDEGNSIIEVAEKFKEFCGKENIDRIQFIEWCVENVEEYRNYLAAYDLVSIGSQHYINDYIDRVNDKGVRRELMGYSYSSIMTTINPIGPNIHSFISGMQDIRYLEKEKRSKAYPIQFADDPSIQEFMKAGYPMDLYDIDKETNKFVVIEKFNQ